MFVERSVFYRGLVFAPTAIGSIAQNKRPAVDCGPSGGLLWIDQEVVTLRGLFGNSGCHLSTILTDLSQAESILTHR